MAKGQTPPFRTVVDSRTQTVHTVRAGTADGGRVRLTPYDLLIGPWYVPLTFFYRRTLDGAALRDSLARTLLRYPPLAGRLERDADGGMSVLCNDAGVRFTEASSPEPMREYGHGLRAQPVIGDVVREVSPFGVVSRDTPLLKIRLTQMRGGGSVLGVLINHTLADGGSALAFLESWSREHLGLPWEEPSHDRGALEALGRLSQDPATRDGRVFARVGRMRHLATSLRPGLRRRATVTTRFEAAELAAMKSEALGALTEPGAWVSTNDVLTAHLWRVVGELRGQAAAAEEWLGLVAGARSGLGDALPPAYWGNCVTKSWTSLPAGELRGRSLGAVADEVRRSLRSNTEDKIRDEIAFLGSHRRRGVHRHVMSARGLDASEASLSVNNWSRFPLYRIDLGAGRPFWYEFPDLPAPTVHIAPTPEEDGGRDVYLCLSESHADLARTPRWQEKLHPHAVSGHAR
ncbi:acyltransferase [Streptomyces pseudogriseolus]|uniref:acyltransferase n=1 Tax=Streptomyces pseudogriseolus TaxID=36817 RepID=UPI003FA22709